MPFLWAALSGICFAAGWLLGRKQSHQQRPPAVPRNPSREQLMAWMNQAPVGWVILDENNQVTFINPRAQRLLGCPVSAPPRSTSLVRIEDIRGLRQLSETVRYHRQPMRLEWDLAEQQLEVFSFPGQQNSIALMMQSRRSLEAQLSQQERWVSDVAHELKTPLTALLLVGDSLAATVSDGNAVLVERLLKELRRMKDLVGDLLELSRLENVLPGQGVRKENIQVKQLLLDAWQGVKPLADEKGISCKMILAPVNSANEVIGDRQRLHRALLNLFDNALRYSPEGSTITVQSECSADWLRIGIRDQGPGLSQQDRMHMFERFYRGDQSRFRQQRGGTGLGLAIVQQIILTHGGWVQGENDAEGGAEFEIRLPRNLNLS